MKTREILKLAEQNDPILAEYVRNWKAEKTSSRVKIEDPVTCIKIVREQRKQIVISSVISIAFFVWTTMTHMPTFLGLIISCLLWFIWLFCSGQHFPATQQDWRKKNATEFVEAMSQAQRGAYFLLDRKELSNEDRMRKEYDWKREHREEMIKACLADEANGVKALQQLPWKKKEADEAKKKFERLLRIMRQLLPNLPADHGAYFDYRLPT